MEKNFPTASEARIQLLYDRHDFLNSLDGTLTQKAESLLKELIVSRPKSSTTALEHLEYQYKGLRLQTMLGITDPHGVFRARVPYNEELRDELVGSGYACTHAPEDNNIMEVLALNI